MAEKQKAVILLSGGLDSTTVLAIAKNQRFNPYTMAFRYGQRHEHELACAQKVADAMDVQQHIIVDVDLGKFGGSALTDNFVVPKGRSESDIESGIPITYVPARNTVFLSFALAWAEVLGAYNIFIGVNAIDYSGYPDCRPAYIAAYERMANLATKAGVEGIRKMTIHTPLIDLSKSEIIQKGISLGVDYSLTNTCYDPAPNGDACGECDACILRLKGFKQVGIPDPAKYV